jgi:hypothetical protein
MWTDVISAGVQVPPDTMGTEKVIHRADRAYRRTSLNGRPSRFTFVTDCVVALTISLLMVREVKMVAASRI